MKSTNSIVLILISIGLFYTFINPQYQEVKRLSALSSEYSAVLESVASIEETRDRLLDEYQTFSQADLDRINKTLPDHVDNVRLALDLSSMAGRHGIALKDVKTTAEVGVENSSVIEVTQGGRPYNQASVSFSFVASHQGFMSFLKDIERSLRLMDLNLTSVQVGESNLYNYQMTVDTYWLK